MRPGPIFLFTKRNHLGLNKGDRNGEVTVLVS